MTCLETIAARHSCRSYLPQPVEAEKLEAVLNAARLAPSAVNFQPCHYYVVASPAKRLAVQAAYNREWFTTAPLYIVVTANVDVAWTRKADAHSHADIDAAIATDHLTLAATALGLGTCWVCNFDVPLLRQALSLPENEQPVAIVPIGYEDKKPEKVQQRKALEEVVTRV